MIDIELIRNNPEMVKKNIKKKFQDKKLPLVDEVKTLDIRSRSLKQEIDSLRSSRNKLSQEIGEFMKQKKSSQAETLKKQVVDINTKVAELETEYNEVGTKINQIMMTIPNIIADDVPVGRSDAENVEREVFGKPKKPDFEIPYHADIMENLCGLDKDSAGKTSGNGFYFLMGDVARLHSAILSYARDFMIDKGFNYCIPPFLIHADVVRGVMSFAEMDAMMYKIEGEDLYMIGTSEHSMIGKYKDAVLKEEDLPICLTSYSPCFRKEVGAHGIEERGIYRVHQFEKQEMIVICKKEEARMWYDKMSHFAVDFFKSLELPVRILESCSGDLADLKVKGCDIEGFSLRQQKYLELGSCSDMGDAQARRLGMRYKTASGTVFANTLNNTVVATPRVLTVFFENHLQKDGSVNIPKALQPYMGGKTKLEPKKK
ncbi:MAG: serine--tRNA ligase [Christensenellaceae bacterium]|nr:serine--tRNA ligase [Christensenellaceae bacterium]